MVQNKKDNDSEKSSFKMYLTFLIILISHARFSIQVNYGSTAINYVVIALIGSEDKDLSTAKLFSINEAPNISSHPSFDTSQTTFVYSTAYNEACFNLKNTRQSPQRIILALKTTYPKCNIICLCLDALVVEDSSLYIISYLNAKSNMKNIACALCNLLFVPLLSIESIRNNSFMLGFSLSSNLYHRIFTDCQCPKQFLKMFVCEPAGPMNTIHEVVSKTDAGCVATMTTNPLTILTPFGPYGTSFHEADVTYLVNNKQQPIQPSCTNMAYVNTYFKGNLNLCSHYFCIEILCDLIENTKKYNAKLRTGVDYGYVTTDCSQIAPGTYYITT